MPYEDRLMTIFNICGMYEQKTPSAKHAPNAMEMGALSGLESH
jgi:hypothetical protein